MDLRWFMPDVLLSIVLGSEDGRSKPCWSPLQPHDKAHGPASIGHLAADFQLRPGKLLSLTELLLLMRMMMLVISIHIQI